MFDSMEKRVINELKLVFDPEIPIDVYELGLIYEISFDKDLIKIKNDDKKDE